jgi:CDP-diacylglycerol---serine O-phosphatidyltransferase
MMREYVNLANLLTSGSLVAGFLALFLILQTNSLVVAAALVAVAAVCDMLDGHVARRNGGGDDDFGTNLDSLADVVSFGAVPAFALYMGSLYKLSVVGFVACLFFFLCGAWRLARFSLCKNPLYFLGCPIPLAGLLVALLAAFEPPPLLALPIALVLGVLMIGTLPIPTISGLKNLDELSEIVEEDRRTAEAD